MKLSYDPAIGFYPKKTKTYLKKMHMNDHQHYL